MTDAYVHAIVDPGAVRPAAERIAQLDTVDTLHVVTGEYDIIAQVSVEDHDRIPEVVAGDIHDISGVVDTVTNVAFEP